MSHWFPSFEQTNNPLLIDLANKKTDSVAAELSALRAEIRALREAVTPPKSVILIGADVERIYSMLENWK